MKSNRLINQCVILLLCLVLAGCGAGGPPAVSDAEFSAAAKEACGTFQENAAKLGAINYGLKAAAYQLALGKIETIKITQASAPNATGFLSAMKDLAASYEAADKALAEALAKVDLKGNVTILVAEDGAVMAHTSKIFDITALDVDPSLIKDVEAKQKALNDLAAPLSLDDCAFEIVKK